jgi:hypothetical protein
MQGPTGPAGPGVLAVVAANGQKWGEYAGGGTVRVELQDGRLILFSFVTTTQIMPWRAVYYEQPDCEGTPLVHESDPFGEAFEISAVALPQEDGLYLPVGRAETRNVQSAKFGQFDGMNPWTVACKEYVSQEYVTAAERLQLSTIVPAGPYRLVRQATD